MADPPQIMIVEDDAATLDYLTMLLETSGYRVQGAIDGAAGRHYASSEPIQGVLLDRRLPDIDGLVLCRELCHELGADVPIIMMTADAEAGLLAATQAAGARRLLRKPFMSHTLLEALNVPLDAS